jgi:hypothetical protein
VAPGSPAPTSGLLSFFHDAVSQSAWGFDPDDKGSWAVIHTTDAAACVPRSWPDGLADPVQGDMQVDCQLASNGIACGGSYLQRG